MANPPTPPESGDETDRCDFCNLPRGDSSVTMEYDEETYEFCSEACRDAMDESDRVFTEYHGFKRLPPGVSALETHLPQGLPRNSFVLLSGEEGTRDGALHAELVWRTLERGEPAVILTFQEPPISVVERFLGLDWNVLPALEDDRLHILDCFTYRVKDRDRMFERMNEWNTYLHEVTRPATTTVRDPSDIGELQNKLDNCLEALEMVDTGVCLIDSLTELGTLVQPVQAYDFVKDLRADVCKGRFVPVLAGATYTGTTEIFPHDLGYVVDGIVDMELNGGIVEDTLLKRIRIRKMSGVLSIAEWTAYEYTASEGLITFDPEAEIAESERARVRRDERADPTEKRPGGQPSPREKRRDAADDGRSEERPTDPRPD